MTTENRRLAAVTVVVDDYDRAIDFYTRVLGFTLLEDETLSASKRWVRVAPGTDGGGCALLLAKAATPEQLAHVGNQTGGRVAFFLHTDDIARDHRRLVDCGVSIVEPLRTAPHGKVLVFADLYGNRWDLIEPAA